MRPLCTTFLYGGFIMYDFKKIEKKWQQYWEENNTFKTDVWDFSKPKYYVLDMFPYPSGVGLHAGHPEGYTATDIVSRMKRMQGYNVLHPMGYDSFGLPAEQYAVTTGNHPDGFTQKNIATFEGQLKSLGFDYDWDRKVSTSDPKFYKWTQWIFKRLYLDGYAKYVDMPVNWCEELGTVLSNDEIIDGKSERGGYPVVRKNMKQWVIDIPAFAEKLLDGLDKIDFPESTKEIEKNWIGKSIGAEVTFKVKNTDKDFTVFTTRCDTLFGATYCVLSPEHKLVDEITTEEAKEEVKKYKEECSKKSELERTDLNKEKTGVFIGAYAINPVNDKEIPIYISDYVLSTYGTGAIMAVPAHDERDYEFARKFNIEIIPVLEGGDISKEAYTKDGIHINSGFLNGTNKEEAIDLMIKYLEEKGYEYTDFGTYTKDSCNYADYGEKVAEAVASGEYDRGILICGTGIGMSIVANKVPGIRCAHCHDSFSARATRMHNDANVIAFGERCIGAGVMLDIVEAFLTTEFEGGRHLARIAKIAEVEKKYSK